MSATLVRPSALGLGAGLPKRKTFTCGSDRVRAVSRVGKPKRTAGLRVVAEDTNWGRELSSAVVRVGAGVLMVHNGLDKLVDPEVRRSGFPSIAFRSIRLLPARSFAETRISIALRNPNAKPTDHARGQTDH
jgi:hypothetical protein